MKNILFSITFLFTILLIGQEAKGQVIYPITASVQFTPPSTTYLTDLTAMGSNQLVFNLFLNDFNELDYGVQLKISIEGNGISLITKPGYRPPIISLFPGANPLSASELSNYFNPSNMLINGISPQALQANGSGLPEGVYTLCVQAFDYYRVDVPLSINSCIPQYFKKNYPPTLVTPGNYSTVPMTGGNQDLFFNWQTNADLSIQTNYKLSIAEVLPNQNPNDAINNSATLIYDGDLEPPIMNVTSFQYGANQQPLVLGKRYAYRIQAEDMVGTTTFENNGLSEVYSFYYGVDPNGSLELTAPDNDARVSLRYNPGAGLGLLGFQWNRPVNAQLTQQIFYRVKIVEVDEGEDIVFAMNNKPAWYESQTGIFSTNGVVYMPEDRYTLPTEKRFAWQVKGFVDSGADPETEMAVSEVRTFKTPPVVEKIRAGAGATPNWITVTSLEKHERLAGSEHRVSGVGKMAITAEGREIDMHFTDVIVVPYEEDGEYSLSEGIIREPVENVIIHLDNSGVAGGNEDEMDEYGEANFDTEYVIVDATSIELEGRVKWRLPHPDQSGNPIVQSAIVAIPYNGYELISDAIPVEAAEFTLTDPLGFKLNYFASGTTSNSEFLVIKDVFTFVLDGSMTTSNKVKNIDNQPVTYHFSNADNPYYFSAIDVAGDDDFRAIPNTMIQVNPKKVTFDLSEEESPAAIPNGLWKGMYFDEFSLLIPTGFDGSNQMSISEDLILNYIQDDESTNMCLISAKGLDLSISNYWLDVQPIMIINTFKSNLSDFAFDVQGNVVTESSYIAGHLGLPCLSPYDYFSFNLDVANNGIQEATINEDLEGAEFTLNGEDYTLATSIKIKQAAFTARSHIKMTIDFIYPAVGIEVENIANFKIWGDGNIGFNSPNGSQMFPIQQNGYVPGNQTYEFTADGLTAFSHPETGSYGFAVSGAASFGENLSGGDKETRMDFASMKVKVDDSTASDVVPGSIANTTSKHVMDGLKGAVDNNVFLASSSLVKSPNGGWFHEIKFIAGPTIKFHTVVLYQPNDPVWGDVSYGVVDMDFGIPVMTSTVSLMAQFISGKIKNETKDFSYGFLELGIGTTVEKSNAAAAFKLLVKPDKEKIEIAESMGLDTIEAYALRSATFDVGNKILAFSAGLIKNKTELNKTLADMQAGFKNTDAYKKLSEVGKTQYDAALGETSRVLASRTAIFKTQYDAALANVTGTDAYKNLSAAGKTQYDALLAKSTDAYKNLSETGKQQYDALLAKSTDAYKNLTKAGKQKYNALLAKGNKISAKLNTQCDKLAFQANKLYYGTKDTRNRSGAVASAYDNLADTRPRRGGMDESGQYSTRLRQLSYKVKQKSLAFKQRAQGGIEQGIQGGIAGIENLATKAKNTCVSTGTMIKNKSKWAGGKMSKFANYTGTKFKKRGKSISDWVGKKQAAAKADKTTILGQISAKLSQPGIPVGGIYLTGVQGRVYWRMSHDVTEGILTGVHAGEKTAAEGATDATAYSKMTMPEFPTNIAFNYLPDDSVLFGLMFMASIESIDAPPKPPSPYPTTGYKYRGYGAFEIAFTNGGGVASIGLEVKADIMNTSIAPFIDNSMLKGYLNIGYHKPEKKFKMTGYYTTASNALCGVGDFVIEQTPTLTEIIIGSKERKLFWLPGCTGFYGTGYMHYRNEKGQIGLIGQDIGQLGQDSSFLDLGLGLGWQATVRQEIGLGICSVTPYASIGAEIGLNAKIQFKPTTALLNFGGWIEAWASLGVYIDWPWPVPDQDIGLDATFSGHVNIVPGTPWNANGGMTAQISVVGLSFSFASDFSTTLNL